MIIRVLYKELGVYLNKWELKSGFTMVMKSLVPLIYLSHLIVLAGCTNYKNEADKILEEAGVQGGLVVHLGVNNGKLTAALHAGRSYVVHGLSRNKGIVDKARVYIKNQGMYGKVSVEHWKGSQLPYISDMVDLVVSTGQPEVSMDEIMRVLSPGGIVYIKDEGEKEIRKKQRPTGMDEWPQYLYNSANSAVSHDTLVGPPRGLQWVGSPLWTRHHDRMESISAMVSSGGRIFYIIDEGSTGSIFLPSDWKLIARDAFNGTILWKKDIHEWVNRFWTYKGGPAQLPRRLVANGDELFATLSLDGPVKKIDAATGKVLQTYENTATTEEIIYRDSMLYLLVHHDFPTGICAEYKANFPEYY